MQHDESNVVSDSDTQGSDTKSNPEKQLQIHEAPEQFYTLTFDDDPSANPKNFPRWRKILILAIASNLIISTTSVASLASGVVSNILADFGINEGFGWKVLPTSIFLVGYSVGNTTVAPLSEKYGRKPVNLTSMVLFLLAVLASALAPNWASFNIFRLIAGIAASGPTSSVSGICADLYEDDLSRGHALLYYNIAQFWGPVLGPIISGYSVRLNWHWAFWFALIYAGISSAPLLWVPETNPGIVLHNRAKQMRGKAKGELRQRLQKLSYAPVDFEPTSVSDLFTKVLSRPLLMFCREPLVFFTCVYIAFQYALIYVFFQSYSLIYEDIYGFSRGAEGLTFLGFGIGCLFAIPVKFIFEKLYLRAKREGRPWAHHHGAARLPLVMLGGPLVALSLFWSGWTSRPSIHWISPVIAGAPYGLGYTLNVNSLITYLIDSYSSYASSANAASSITRQLLGAALPFAAVPMYRALGIGLGNTVLGSFACAFSFLPFLFWRYGEKILEHSRFAQELKQDEENHKG